jgi:hypothetical protein
MKDAKFTTAQNERFHRAVSISIIIIIMFLILYSVSLAWFGQRDENDSVLIVGNVALYVTTDINLANEPLEPNKLFTKTTKIKGNTNESNPNNIDAYIRAKIDTDIKDSVGKSIIIPEFTIANSANWVYNAEDNWYYYIGYINTETEATFNNFLRVSNDLVNLHAGEQIRITLTIHAIQREYQAYLGDPSWATAPQAWIDAIAPFDIVND